MSSASPSEAPDVDPEPAAAQESGDEAEEGAQGAVVTAKKKKRTNKKARDLSAQRRAQPLSGAPPAQKGSRCCTLPSFDHVKHLLPWSIQVLPGRGRCAVATRAVAAGELVLLERAVAYTPRDAHAHRVCQGCLCQLPGGGWCSQRCEDAQGETHRRLRACSTAVAAAAAAHRVDVELLRLVAAVADATCAVPAPGGEPDQKPLAALPLRATGEDVRALLAPSPPSLAVQAACEALALAAPHLQPPGASLALLAAVINGNAHGLGAQMIASDGTGGVDVAVGLFPFLSMLNHSCAPNCVFVAAPGDAGVMAVRASRAVAAGAELCVCYVNAYEPRSVRRAATQTTKGFICQCERCAAPLASSFDRFIQGAHCRACRADVCVAPEEAPADQEEWICCGCGARDGGAGAALSRSAGAALTEAMELYGRYGHKAAEPLLVDLLGKYEHALNPHHVTVFDARTPLLNCARARGDAAAAVTHCTAVLASLEASQGAGAETANFWACLGELYGARSDGAKGGLLCKAYRTRAKEAFAKAASLRTTCLGAHHPATLAAEAKASGRAA